MIDPDVQSSQPAAFGAGDYVVPSEATSANFRAGLDEDGRPLRNSGNLPEN